jgi:hypothetical protein
MVSSMKAKMANAKRRITPLCKAVIVDNQRSRRASDIKKDYKQSSVRATSNAKEERIVNKHGKLVSNVRHCAGKKAQKSWLDSQVTRAVVSDRARQAKSARQSMAKVAEPLGKAAAFAQNEAMALKREMEEQSAELDGLKESEESSRRRGTELSHAAAHAANELRREEQKVKVAEDMSARIRAEIKKLLAEQARADQAHKDALAVAHVARIEVDVANRAREEETRNLKATKERIARVMENVAQAKCKFNAAFSHALTITVASDRKRDGLTTPRRKPSGEHQRSRQTPQKKARIS